jgi:glucosamine--fructose-6-phosphate aminotransferase (isomerizing)
MTSQYISFANAREGQANALKTAIRTIRDQVLDQQDEGEFRGPGPIFVGIGASFAATCAPVWHLRSRGIHSWRLGAGDHPLPFPATDHPIIGVSQSGRSSETLAVLKSVDSRLAYAVVNNDSSPITEVVRRTLPLGNIPDSYASTIGYTATIVGLGMIADVWNGGTIDPGWDELYDLVQATESDVSKRATELAEIFVEAPSADFVGAGPSLGTAEAATLLFREVVRLPSTAMSTRQYLHGAMESAGAGTHVVLGDDRELEMAQTLSSAGHRVIVVSSKAVAEGPRLRAVRLPKLPASQRAVLEAIVMQTLVAELAELSDIDVEQFVFHHTDTKVADDHEAGATA